jgi:TolB-like protein/Tfp pilus assembly protein PilF
VQQLVARKVPAPVIALLRSMLAVDPEERPASARELMEAIEECWLKLTGGDETTRRSFFAELQRRNVYKVAVAYAVVAWLLMQVASQIFPFFEIPNWTIRLVIMLLALGFPIALVLAWAFELTPEGIKRTEEVNLSKSIRRKTGRKLDFLIIAVLLLVIAALLFQRFHPKVAPAIASSPEKSIAVLPFENLSRDPDNAYFADGVQEEVLTRLASIAGLKVISRTSTQQYQSKPRNLREIAQQLGVANILEGSVQKAADQVRVNVQLVNAQTDSHLWADTYDRKLTDIFGVESEIAKRIAEALQAKLTGHEEQALAVKPTNNPEAYDVYLRGLAFYARTAYSRDFALKAVDSYERAVQLDPNFAVAWARLSRADAELYFNRVDTTAARRDAAKNALENAQKLQPNSPETLLALGYYQYLVLRDYGLAKSTFALVRKMLPGSSDVLDALGRVARREGSWDESIAYFEQTLVLDPRNVQLLLDVAWTYNMLRQFPAALKLYDRALDVTPNDPGLMAAKADIYQAQGNLQEAAKVLSEIKAQAPSPPALATKIIQLRLERNLGDAVRLAQTRPTQYQFAPQISKSSDQVILALVQRLNGDTAGANAAAQQARNTLQQLCKDQPENSDFAGLLSVANAELGEKSSALKGIERAMMLLPSAKDRVEGPTREEALALIQMIFGENGRAISTLTRLLRTPYSSWLYGTPVTPALLRLDPIWDPLRADPAFQKLCEQKSIAVLPFENLSRDPDNAYFADGIQEEILTRLSKIADFKVISRTSTQRYQSKPGNLSEIGKQLGVTNILEGSVQKAADQVRVNVQLINAATDAHLWAETYDRKLTDIFGVESEIATKIADVLQAKLTGAEQRAIAARSTENSEAYELYLRGRYFLGKRSEGDLKNAVDYFNRAIAEDRNYAPAYAGLAATYVLFVYWTPAEPAESLRKAREAAIKALEIDNSLAEAHAALALVLMFADFDLRGAQRELERAIQLNPNYAAVHQWLAWVLESFGEYDQAILERKRAVELDPFSPFFNAGFGWSLVVARRYPEAIAQLRKTIELEPNFFFSHGVLGAALVLNGQIDEGIAEYERAEQLRPDVGKLGFLVNAYARKGDRQKALQTFERIKQSSNSRILAFDVAISYVGLGDKNEAMNWLERSYAQQEGDIFSIRVNPFLEPLHGDPRFEALAQKVLPNQ